MGSDFETFRQRKNFGSLNGLRAISIIGVVWYHAARQQNLLLADQGWMGVPLFFVISGFLIVTLLLRERARNGTISLWRFYGRRSLRIFPLYYTVLAVYVVTVLLLEKDIDDRSEFFNNLKFFLTYTSNWFVPLPDQNNSRIIFYFAWSLAVEEQFYLVWPSIERWLPSTGAGILMILTIIIRQLVDLDIIPIMHGSLLRTMVLSIAPTICLGVILAHVLNDRRGYQAMYRLVGGRYAGVILLALVLGALLLHSTDWIVFVLMALLVAACVVREDHVLARLLTTKAFVSIGAVSYGIYLLHMLTINLIERVAARVHVDSRFVLFVVAFVAVWGVARISFDHYESWFLRLKERFRV